MTSQPTTTERLIATFRAEVVERSSAVAAADHRRVNRIARNIDKAFRSLIAQNDEGRRALIELTADPNPEVALMAAVYSFGYDPERCKQVLTTLSDNPLVEFAAKQSIRNWEAGRWDLEPGVAKHQSQPQADGSEMAHGKAQSVNDMINSIAA